MKDKSNRIINSGGIMTREMNKPEYHATWYFRILDSVDSINCTFEIPKERKLDDWIKPFFDNCCRMEKIER